MLLDSPVVVGPPTITTSNLSEFDLAVQTLIQSMLVAGTNVTLDFDEINSTLTIAATGGGGADLETIQDAVGAMVVAGANIDAVYNDAAGTITISSTNAVDSVNGLTGVVVLDAAAVGALASDGIAASATKLETARTINGVAFDGTANVTVEDSTKLPLAGGTLTGLVTFDAAVIEKQAAVAASDIDLSVASLFTKTIAGATTFTVSNVPTSGKVASFILDLTNGGSAVITWWSNIKWAAGVAPTLTAAGRDILGFITADGGTTWIGQLLSKDAK